jgi:hypothetical protein
MGRWILSSLKMKLTVSFVLAGILTCGAFAQAIKRASPTGLKQQQPPGGPTVLRSKFDFDTFVITKSGLLTLKGQTNEFLLIPGTRFPGELRSLQALDFQDRIYVARFGEPGGIGVEGFYDICFQIKAGKVLTHSLELGGSLERISDKVLVRSSSYLYDRADKKVLKIQQDEPATPMSVALTNVLRPFISKE